MTMPFAPTGMNWSKLIQTVFLSLIYDFGESEISVNFFSIENPFEITNF